MSRARYLPNRDRLSVLTAIIVLAYALARVLDLPTRAMRATVLGSALGIELNGPLLMLLLAAALISAGSDALFRSHPYFARHPSESAVSHWLLPGITALVLGSALNRAPTGPAWWLGLVISALALLAVLVAEYVVVDRGDAAWDVAALALTALAYALALILFTLLRSFSTRAVISASIGGLVAAGLAWRLFILRIRDVRPMAALFAGLVGLIAAESIWAFNYWRITASSAALLTMVPFYTSFGLFQQQLAGRLTRRVWVEYAVVGAIGLTIALLYAWVWSR